MPPTRPLPKEAVSEWLKILPAAAATAMARGGSAALDLGVGKLVVKGRHLTIVWRPEFSAKGGAGATTGKHSDRSKTTITGASGGTGRAGVNTVSFALEKSGPNERRSSVTVGGSKTQAELRAEREEAAAAAAAAAARRAQYLFRQRGETPEPETDEQRLTRLVERVKGFTVHHADEDEFGHRTRRVAPEPDGRVTSLPGVGMVGVDKTGAPLDVNYLKGGTLLLNKARGKRMLTLSTGQRVGQQARNAMLMDGASEHTYYFEGKKANIAPHAHQFQKRVGKKQSDFRPLPEDAPVVRDAALRAAKRAEEARSTALEQELDMVRRKEALDAQAVAQQEAKRALGLEVDAVRRAQAAQLREAHAQEKESFRLAARYPKYGVSVPAGRDESPDKMMKRAKEAQYREDLAREIARRDMEAKAERARRIARESEDMRAAHDMTREEILKKQQLARERMEMEDAALTNQTMTKKGLMALEERLV